MIRIVLIEDDSLMREWLGRSLSSRGFLVSRFGRADTAIEALGEVSPDVVVSDVRLPGLSGLELASALRERGIDVPVILMTADPDDGLEEQALACGARRLLRKPFPNLAVLWNAVDEALGLTPEPDDVTRASHALRTPLTAVRMAFEGLLAERQLDSDQQRLADIATRNLDRLTAALEDHLERLALLSDRRAPVD